jgi:hypothetical protein
VGASVWVVLVGASSLVGGIITGGCICVGASVWVVLVGASSLVGGIITGKCICVGGIGVGALAVG